MIPMPAPVAAGSTEAVTAGFRPESLELVSADEGFAVTIDVVEELGSDAFIYGSFAGDPAGAISTGHDVVARVDPRTSPAKGDTLHLRVRRGELHLFDAQTGERLN